MAKPLTCLFVTISSKEDGVSQIVVTDSSFFIGRSHDCAIALPALNVSRQHVRIKNKGGNVWVEDLSANGTYINGDRIDKKRLTPLEPGDRLRLGSASAEITIASVDRAFSEKILEETSLNERDHDSVMNLIHGAHAEALRLANLGKVTHDNFVKAAEERAASLEQKMTSDHTAIIAEAKGKAAAVLNQAEKDRVAKIALAEREAVEAFKVMGEQIKVEAKERAEKEARESIQGAIKDLERLLAERDTAEEKVEDALKQVKKMRTETEDLREEAKGLNLKIKEMREQEKKRDGLEKEIAELKSELEKEAKRGRKDLDDEIAALKATQLEKLKEEMREPEKRRSELAAQVSKLTEQLNSADQEHKKKIAEHKAIVEKETAAGRKEIIDELTQLRLKEMDRLKKDRAAAIAEISRERERLSQKILVDMEKTAVKSMAVENWRPVSDEMKDILLHHLQMPSLSSNADHEMAPLMTKAARNHQTLKWRWMAQGLVAGLLIFAAANQAIHHVNNEMDPMKAAAEEQARRVQEDLAKRKFNPDQDDEWRDKYVDAVIYTRNFAEQYRSEEFQKHWLKTASTYFLKKWKVQEESVFESIAKVSTLIGVLSERKEGIHPDFVQDGLKKMNDLEAATLAEVQELLGSEVRVEAFKRMEKKTYLDFFSMRQPAATEEDVSN